MKARKINPVTIALFALFVAAIMVISGCESSSNDDNTTGTIQIASLTASPSSIDIGASSVIVATISDGTNVLSSREVSFSVSAIYGTCSPTTDTTDANGEASALFAATTAGTAVITATMGGLTRTVNVSITDPSGVDTTSTGEGNVHMTATPTIITANGTDSSLITVTVLTDGGSVAPDGTLIKYVAGEKFDDIDDNGYFTTGVDTVIYDINGNGMWDPIGSIQDTATVTGGNGQAHVYYYAGTSAQTVYIRGTVSDEGYVGYAQTTVQLNATAEIHSIFLATEEMHIAVAQTGGMQTSYLYATGFDANGDAVPQGIPISFIITDGPDTSAAGEHLGNLTGPEKRGPYVSMTNASGTASCPITSGTIPGTIRMRAYVGTVLSNSTQIMVHAGPPATINVAVEECNVPYWGKVNYEVGVTAQVKDAYNNPVADSIVVYFTTDEGNVLAHESPTVEERGIANSVWLSSGPEGDGEVWVYAETSGGTLRDSVMFINSWIPYTLTYLSFPDDMDANLYSKGFIYVQVQDENGHGCVQEFLQEIKFDADVLEFTDRENGDGCWASGVSNNVVSTVLKRDYSMPGGDDDGIGLVEDVTARWGFISSITDQVTLHTGPAYRENCELSLENSAPSYNETVYFSAQIRDQEGNPLGDHTLVASASAGVISSTTFDTDQYGIANGFSIVMPDSADGFTNVTITVQDIDPRGNIWMQESVELTAE